MANVRIKDLSTTASTTASDDFFGVDGATNGTRKLNAYSPTFGGNLTVSGASSVLGAGTGVFRLTNGGGDIDSSFATASASTTDSVYVYSSASQSAVGFGVYNGTRRVAVASVETGSTVDTAGSESASLVFKTKPTGGSLTTALTIDSTQNTTLSGNLTVSGNASTFNTRLFINATSLNQFLGDGTGFGLSTSSFGIRNDQGNVVLAASGSAPQFTLTSTALSLTGNLTVSGGTITSGSGTLTLNSSANTVVLQSAGTTALTLDASQNATFAGRVRIGGTTASFPALRNTGAQLDVVTATAGAWASIAAADFKQSDNGISWSSGSGSPEGVKTAPVGSIYSRTDGGASTTLYVKESGSGNTGWIAK